MNESRWCSAPIRFDLGVIATRTQLPALVQTLTAAGFSQRLNLEAFRLRAADPGVPGELTPNTIPLEAHLDDAVHENKGCYPGQEVVERIRSMGQVPRELVRIHGLSGETPAVAAELRVGDQVAGTLTSVAPDPVTGGWVGLGYVKRIFAKSDASYTIAGQSVDVQFKR